MIEAKFIDNNKFIEITKCSDLELEQLEIDNTISWWKWRGREKEKKTRSFLHSYRYLPAGFWLRLLKMTKRKFNVDFQNVRQMFNNITVEDIEEWLETVPLKNNIYPYDYQLNAVYLAAKYRISRGQYATGAGKTFIFYLLSRYALEKLNAKKILIVVPSVGLVTQTEKEFLNEYQGDDFISVDPIYGGSKRNKDANVCIANIDSLLQRDIDFFDDFDVVLYDEAHKLSTEGYKQVYNYLYDRELKIVFGASGTFHQEDVVEAWDAESIAGPIMKVITTAELIQTGVLTPVKIASIVFDYDDVTSLDYYNLPGIGNVDKKNSIELDYVRSIKKRLDYISSIVSKMEFNQLCLFKSVAYAKKFKKILEELCPDKQIHLIVGEVTPEKREEIKKLTEENYNVVIVATYGTMSTGISIKNLSTLHFVEGAKSFIWVLQSIGRLLRLHKLKKLALVFDYTDMFRRPKEGVQEKVKAYKSISVSHLKERLKIYAKQKFPVVSKVVKL